MTLSSFCFQTFFKVLLKNTKYNDILFPSRNEVCLVRVCAFHRLKPDEDDSGTVGCSGKTRNETLLHSLQSVYDCTGEQGERVVKSRELKHVFSSSIVNNAKCLKENGLHVENLITYPWVLGYNPQLLPLAVKHLKALHHDVNVSLPLLTLPYTKLVQLSRKVHARGEESRLKWLSEILEVDDEHLLSKTISKHTYMLTMPRERVLHVVDILKGGGVAPQDMARDLSIFRYNPDQIKERCDEARKSGIVSLRPWSLRCPEQTFQRMIKKRVTTRELLGDYKSAREYLTGRLKCEEDTVSYIIKKIPQLKYITVVKVKELLDFLYEVGYTPNDVCQASRILTRSVKTVKTRFKQLRDLNLDQPNLFILCKTNKQYKEFIAKMKDDK